MTDTPQRQLDTRAIELATRADQRITSHERDCERRQGEIIAEFKKQSDAREERHKELKGSVGEIRDLMFRAMVGVILLLIAIVGYFLVTFGLPGAGPARSAHAAAVESEALP